MSLSCGAWSPSGLQTAEVRLPQDFINVVIGDTAAVAMETMLCGAGRVFRIWAEGVQGNAVVLAVHTWTAVGSYHPLWTTDPITTVTAGRLRIPDISSQI